MPTSITGQTILVVDDDKEIVRLVRAYLEKAGYQVLTAYDGSTALHILRRERPALVVLDLMLPDQDGWDITRLVRSDPALASMPIIMLTARIDDTDKIIGLELGADDYVTKPFNPREVVARVRSVLRRAHSGVAAPQSRVLTIGDLSMDVNRHLVTLRQQEVELTATEFNLLKVLLENPGYAYTRSELIEQALGYEYEGSERTLDSHMRNLRRKIDPDTDRPSYIQTVYGVGYRLMEP
ncbi:MAG TPA: response regulator transcription factor [Anaerolineae bacterium]|nr:response regulator transcription factor [Anaerolineae bacterium]MCB0223716.1 response regulator transcription factor [Anaerolineae bacterium]MCB9107699.1 response regulator transcription factor [Anaerolineales bacterium]HRV96003.1 response regulator transcription factor [Anaerolineae bacterium]